MNVHNCNRSLRRALVAMCLIAPAFASGALVALTEAVEATRVDLNDDATYIRVFAPCDGCAPKDMQFGPDVHFIENGRPSSLQRLVKHSGSPATVVYDLKSGHVIRVYWSAR